MSKETPIQRLKVGGQYYVLMLLDEYQALANAANALSKALTEPKGIHEYANIGPDFQSGETHLRAWRKYRGLTLAELSEIVGISQSYLTLVERGQRQGRPLQWRSLAEALRVTIEDILPLD